MRLSLLSAAVWWAAFTVIPYRGIRNRPPTAVVPEPGGLVRQSFGQLVATLRDMRNYPMTLTFLLAYLFYNDGIQTVIASASSYGEKQLGLQHLGADRDHPAGPVRGLRRRAAVRQVAASRGSRRVILVGLVMWMLVVTVGYFIPEKNLPLFLALAVGIGLVLGGTQALSRSFFSQLIPRGREAEYFRLYQACERGTSWLGTLRLRPGAPVDRLLPAGDLRAGRVLRRGRSCCCTASTRAAVSPRRATRCRTWSE